MSSRLSRRGGGLHREDVQPIVEILAEAPRLHHGQKIAVSGGNQPDVGMERFDPAHPAEDIGLEKAKQLRLDGKRQFPDLVEKEGPPGRRLHQSRLAGVGAGKGPLFMAEELAFDEVFRKPRAIHGHEGAVGPGRELVDGQRHQLLPRPRLAVQENGGGLGRHLVDGRHHPDKGGRFPDKSFRSRIGAAGRRADDPLEVDRSLLGILPGMGRPGSHRDHLHAGKDSPVGGMMDMEGPGRMPPLPSLEKGTDLAMAIAGDRRVVGDLMTGFSHHILRPQGIDLPIGPVCRKNPVIVPDDHTGLGEALEKLVEAEFMRRGSQGRREGNRAERSHQHSFLSYLSPIIGHPCHSRQDGEGAFQSSTLE